MPAGNKNGAERAQPPETNRWRQSVIPIAQGKLGPIDVDLPYLGAPIIDPAEPRSLP
jgi:hypothetical protein